MHRLVAVQRPFGRRFPCAPVIVLVLGAVAVVRRDRKRRQIVSAVG